MIRYAIVILAGWLMVGCHDFKPSPVQCRVQCRVVESHEGFQRDYYTLNYDHCGWVQGGGLLMPENYWAVVQISGVPDKHFPTRELAIAYVEQYCKPQP